MWFNLSIYLRACVCVLVKEMNEARNYKTHIHSASIFLHPSYCLRREKKGANLVIYCWIFSIHHLTLGFSCYFQIPPKSPFFDSFCSAKKLVFYESSHFLKHFFRRFKLAWCWTVRKVACGLKWKSEALVLKNKHSKELEFRKKFVVSLLVFNKIPNTSFSSTISHTKNISNWMFSTKIKASFHFC